MARSFLFLLLFVPFTRQPGHLIDWNATRKLTWSDFLGNPDNNNENAALTCSNINFKYGYGTAGFNFTISCRFDKRQSWGRIKNDYVLAHEQGHFDLAEIYARKLNKALKEYHYNERTVSKDVSKIYQDLMDEHHKVQNDYDVETDHSLNKDKQQTWFKKIVDDLRKYDGYADYRK